MFTGKNKMRKSIFEPLKRVNQYSKEYGGIGICREDFLRGALKAAIKNLETRK